MAKTILNLTIINVILLFCILAYPLDTYGKDNSDAQMMTIDSTLFYFNIGGGANMVMNKSEVPLIGLNKDCGCYDSGNSSSWFFNFGAGYSLVENIFSVELGLLAESRPAFLQSTTTDYEVLTSSGSYQNLEVEHSFDAPLVYSSLFFGAHFQPLVEYPFTIGGVVDIGMPFFGADYTNQQYIKSPSGVYFGDENNQTLGRTTASGEYDGLQANIGIGLSVRYSYALNDEISIQPELSYRHGLNSISSETDWYQNIVRLGANVNFDFYIYERVYGREKQDEIPEQVPPLPVSKEDIVAAPDSLITTIEPQEDEVNAYLDNVHFEPIKLTETIVSQTYPILPYIFFEPASYKIPNRYAVGNPSSFNPSKLPKSTLDIYYSTLDIIGFRMLTMDGDITVTGYHNGKEVEGFDEQRELAVNRALAIKKYLTSNWGIDGDRIITKPGELPPISTSNQYDEGPEENSRAEITTDNPSILEPIVFKNFLEYTVDDKAFVPKLDAYNEEAISGIDLRLVSEEEILLEYEGSISELRKAGVPYNQESLSKLAKAIDADNQIEIVAITYDLSGKSLEYKSKLTSSKELSDYEIGRINLIVFDFDRSDLSEENKLMLEKFAVRDEWERSTITVTGSTDRLGEKNYNRELSLSRAKSTEEYLKKINSGLPEMNVLGLGSTYLPFDNSLPEGRFYCRTVLIEVKTPLQD